MTHPDPRVIEAIQTRFIPLQLDLFADPREVLRPLNVIWTPTVLFADRRGTVHYQSVDFLPPELYLTLLDIGEAHVAMHWSRADVAIALLQRAYERDTEGPFAAEALYWWGVATYLKTRSNAELDRVRRLLLDRFPRSIWAARVP